MKRHSEALAAALRGYAKMCDDGWICPEDKSEEYELGWHDACAQFGVSKTHGAGIAALAAYERAQLVALKRSLETHDNNIR
jgi:hypothetical protein